MKLIEDIQTLDDLIGQYYTKGTKTNNYLLSNAYQEYLDAGKLFFVEENSNAFLLVKKEGFYRMYYYVNDSDQLVQTSLDLPCVMEIIYRGEKRKPTDEIEFWERSGFKQHLVRDNMMAAYDRLGLPSTVNSDVQVYYATSEEDVSFVKEQLEGSLDKYTGDQMDITELKNAAENKNILLAKWENEPAGFLRFYLKNRVVWLGHIVVSSDYRGKGIAKELVRNYIERNKTDEKTRYSLWVIQDNIGAVKLYQKFGFIYANKSSASLLKLQ